MKPLEKLIRALDSCPAKLTAGNINNDRVVNAFRELAADPVEIVTYCRDQLKMVSSGGDETLQLFGEDIYVHIDPAYKIGIKLVNRPNKYLHAVPFHGLLAPLNGRIRCFSYELPSNYRNDVFDRGVQLKGRSQVEVAPGDVVTVGPDVVTDLWPVEPYILLKVIQKPALPLEWFFDRASLKAVSCSEAYIALTHAQLLIGLLPSFQQSDALATANKFLHHDYHQIRWAALKAINSLAPEKQ